MIVQNNNDLLNTTESLETKSLCLVMAAGSSKFIFPRVLIAEVFRYDDDLFSDLSNKDLKLLSWRGFKVPVASCRLINQNTNFEITSECKVVVFHGLLNPEKLPYYALLSSNNPALIDISEENLSKSKDLSKLSKGESIRVMSDAGEAVIPKIEYLENFILDNYLNVKQ